MERRRHRRHDLSAAVKFDWESSDNTHCQGTGITRDFSVEGLFVMTENPPPVGTAVHFEVDLKTARLDSAAIVRAKGKVNRIETTNSTGRLGGFAISARTMRLGKPEPPSGEF